MKKIFIQAETDLNLSERILDKKLKKKNYGRLIYRKSMEGWELAS
jgi:hypothetical protein